MSHSVLDKNAAQALGSKHWGGKVRDENGTLRDTGVQELAEEVIRLLQAGGPLTLNEPLRLKNNTNGPAIIIYNDGPLKDWMGIRVRDKAGNEAQFGIGLGNENLLANAFVPHPDAAITPEDQHRFYSDLGGNAGADREHPKAVEANNGLVWPLGLNGQFQVPILDWFKPAQFIDDDCHPVFRIEWFSQPAYIPTYIPQSLLIKGTASENFDFGESGNVLLPNGQTVEAHNGIFLCIDSGMAVILACIDGQYEVISREETQMFYEGTTAEAIAKGGSGLVNVSGGQIEATSPYDSLTCDVAVFAVRQGPCAQQFTIIAAECWDEDRCP